MPVRFPVRPGNLTRAVARSGPSNTYGITGPTKAGHEYNKIGRLSREFPVSGMVQMGNSGGVAARSLFREVMGEQQPTYESLPRPAPLDYGYQKRRKVW